MPQLTQFALISIYISSDLVPVFTDFLEILVPLLVTLILKLDRIFDSRDFSADIIKAFLNFVGLVGQGDKHLAFFFHLRINPTQVSNTGILGNLQPTDISFFHLSIGADSSPFQSLQLRFDLALFLLELSVTFCGSSLPFKMM